MEHAPLDAPVSPSKGVRIDDGLALNESIQESPAKHFHGLEREATEEGAHVFPECSLAARFFYGHLVRDSDPLVRSRMKRRG
jgi:hypothetical protein